MRDDRVQLDVQVFAQSRSCLDVIDAQARAADVQQVRLAVSAAQVILQRVSADPLSGIPRARQSRRRDASRFRSRCSRRRCGAAPRRRRAAGRSRTRRKDRRCSFRRRVDPAGRAAVAVIALDRVVEHHEAREVQHREPAERQQCVCCRIVVDDFQQAFEAIDGVGPDCSDDREHFMRHQGLDEGREGPVEYNEAP